jgi:hypothetical protein
MATRSETALQFFLLMLIVGVSVQTGAAYPPPAGLLPLDALPQEPVVALELTPVDETELPEPAPPSEPATLDSAVPGESAPAELLESDEKDDSPTKESAESAEEKAEKDPDAPPEVKSPDADVRKNPGESVIVESEDDELGERLERIFRINENSMSWVLRSGDTDGIGFFSWESTPAWDFNLDEAESVDAEFHSGIHWVDGPGRTDLPPRMFDLAWHVRIWQPDFIDLGGEPISVEADFNIGLHSDFEDSAREGWRFPGRLLFMQEASPGFWWTAGFEYLDLDHIQMLPAGGFILKAENAQLDLYFPRPKLRIRTAQKEQHDQWLYVEGEYRGRGWAIERSTTGLADVATLSEYRLGVGWETVPTRRGSDDDGDSNPQISFFDVSWLFGRDLEYRSGAGNYQPLDTVMFRVGCRY